MDATRRGRRLALGLCLMTAVAAGAASPKKPAQKGFVGHFGFVLSYPSELRAEPGFASEAEMVQFKPAKPCPPGAESVCAKAGWINFAALPKAYVARENKVGTFEEFMDGVYYESSRNGESPAVADAEAGGMPARTFSLASPMGPFNRFTYVEGRRHYYRFAYDADNPHAAALIASLADPKPLRAAKPIKQPKGPPAK